MTFGSHDNKGFGTEAANGTIHDRPSAFWASVSLLIGESFCYIYSNLS